MKCRFAVAFSRPCGRQAEPGQRVCADHRACCCSCGRQATRSCEEKLLGRVCHQPLCSRCVHLSDSEHGLLPDDPTPDGMARDLTRTVLEREPAPRTTRRTAVEDLRRLLVELES